MSDRQPIRYFGWVAFIQRLLAVDELCRTVFALPRTFYNADGGRLRRDSSRRDSEPSSLQTCVVTSVLLKGQDDATSRDFPTLVLSTFSQICEYLSKLSILPKADLRRELGLDCLQRHMAPASFNRFADD
jgi:hypothetical protein